MKTDPETLIDAAAELLDKGGPEAVTLRGVGLASGVSRGAPYRHFATKTQLLAAIAARELDRLAAAFSGEDQSGALAAREMMMLYLLWALEYPERFRLTFGRWDEDDPQLGSAAARAREVFVAAVTQAQQQGALPNGDPIRLAALLLAATHGVADLALAGHLPVDRSDPRNVEGLVTDLFGHLLTAAGRGRSPEVET